MIYNEFFSKETMIINCNELELSFKQIIGYFVWTWADWNLFYLSAHNYIAS